MTLRHSSHLQIGYCRTRPTPPSNAGESQRVLQEVQRLQRLTRRDFVPHFSRQPSSKKTGAQLAVAPDTNRCFSVSQALHFFASRFARVNRKSVRQQWESVTMA